MSDTPRETEQAPQNPAHNSTKAKFGPSPQPFRKCVVVGCSGRAWGDNIYCKKHNLRAVRHGDPTIVLKRGRKKRGE